jgi:MFS family permease
MRNVRSFFIAYSVGAILVRLTAGHLIDRIGHRRSAVWSLAAYGLVTAATSLLAPGQLALYGGLFGVFHGLFFPAIMALAIDPKTGQRAQPLALVNGTFAAGGAFVPLLGALADAIGYPWVFVASGVATLAIVSAIPTSDVP